MARHKTTGAWPPILATFDPSKWPGRTRWQRRLAWRTARRDWLAEAGLPAIAEWREGIADLYPAIATNEKDTK